MKNKELKTIGLWQLLYERWPGASTDARADMGYGTLNPRFQKPRFEGDAFPYTSIDDYADVVDEEFDEREEKDLESIRDKSLNFQPTDSFLVKYPKTVYFAEGSHCLTACFWRTQQMLEEIVSFGDSMVAIPQVSKVRGRGRGGGGVSNGQGSFPYPGGGGSNYKRTGTLRGWSQSPPALACEDEDLFDENVTDEEDTHIYFLKDLAKSELNR